MGFVALSRMFGNAQRSIYLLVLCTLVLVCLHLKHSKPSWVKIHPKMQKTFNISNFSACLNKSGRNFYTSLKPSMQCPLNLLKRVGRSGDGGKWTCGLSNLELIREAKFKANHNHVYEPCLVYSFGVKDDSSWEAEVLATTHCAVYAYDPTVNSIAEPLKSSNNRVHFEKLGLGGDDLGNKRTLATLMKINGHKNNLIHILKLDIEGWEYPVLENLFQDFPDDLPFAQLLVEFHVWDWSLSIKAQIIVKIFSTLEKRGIRLFHVDDFGDSEYSLNMCSEFSFINEKYLHLFGVD